MKILFVGSLSGIGGAERSLMPLARQLREQGHELTLFLARPPQDAAVFEEFDGAVDIPSEGYKQISKRIARLGRLVKLVNRTDVVVATSELTVTYVSWLLAALCRKPLLADVQVHLSGWIRDNCHPAHRFLSRWVYKRVRAIRCVSEGVAKDLREEFGVSAGQIVVIPVPFDLGEIRRVAEQRVAARDTAVFQRPVIVGAGRLTSQKRFDIAIRALESLRRRHGVDANLLILGEGDDRASLEQQARGLGLADRCFLPGHAENLPAYLRSASVFLLSSDYEGLPRVLIEALAVGCPAVATDCPSGPYEILNGGIAGLLAPCGDADGLADALARVLTDTELAEKLRRLGPQRVEVFETIAVARAYSHWLEKNSRTP